jgi:hypothetical protein
VAAYAAPAPDPAPPAPAPAAEPLANGSYSGKFANLMGAPEGAKAVEGTATMVISAGGTRVSINVSGLDPKAVYVAHVHKAACADDDGGTHFQFTPGGDPKPPNEIWITPIKVSPTGKAQASTKATGKANSSAKSVVIHLKQAAGAPPPAGDAKPPKLACADLAK